MCRPHQHPARCPKLLCPAPLRHPTSVASVPICSCSDPVWTAPQTDLTQASSSERSPKETHHKRTKPPSLPHTLTICQPLTTRQRGSILRKRPSFSASSRPIPPASWINLPSASSTTPTSCYCSPGSDDSYSTAVVPHLGAS
ncbi:uncharacterized protein BDZ83DRAFT_635036 [Colletotrichum acutatum]|uniref:Uncharacterized protein n=1 Tax=Glomerella acutata TaxID=27357 RepID=A0AAD8UFA8_GLOAC|nr:uncharacterized protein BDZ83DRAFT_635036 [Colletotrichum acutatum]KAK1716077.1 hypothetical protein BDZ83DRAFT_635036 [Colletotrichum acutatum]